MILLVNFWGRSTCTAATGPTEGDRSERCSYLSNHVNSRLRSLAIESIDVNHPMASLRAVDSLSQVAIKLWERGAI